MPIKKGVVGDKNSCPEKCKGCTHNCGNKKVGTQKGVLCSGGVQYGKSPVARDEAAIKRCDQRTTAPRASLHTNFSDGKCAEALISLALIRRAS